MGYLVGIDIGGTKTEVAILELIKGKVEGYPSFIGLDHKRYTLHDLGRDRVPTGRQGGYEAAFVRIRELCRKLLHEVRVSPAEVEGLGIGLPGPVDPVSQLMLTGNSSIFKDQNIGIQLKEALGIGGLVRCGNDANCFTLAEALAGAGVDFCRGHNGHNILGVILGTGVGGGFFTGNKIYQGRRGGACEWGHMTLFENGHPCYCGNMGCVEQYLSGPALEATFASRIYSQIKSRPNSAEIFQLAESQDPIAIAVIKQYKRYLAKFLGIITQLYDPDAIILGGGMSLQGQIYEGIQELMQPFLFIKERPPTVLHHKLGDSAGVIGAALLPLFD